ncbi:beta-lactamase family protein, partial [bacterium]|nr:beta-lactamase family protein [bacterium]
ALQRASAFGFSGAVLIALEGEVILSKGYGWADRSKEIPITPETAFAVASITKPFTAAAILKLEQQNKLKTSDSISTYLGSVPVDKQKITIQHLLTHTSGLADQYAAAGITDRSQAIQRILTMVLQGAPGESFRYSNDGYNLLAAIVEIVSGKTFSDYVREELFVPAGMKESGFWGEPNFLPENRIAHNYNMETDNGAPQYIKASWADRGSSDMITTVHDLFRWHLALQNGKIFPPEILKRMYSPQAKREEEWYYGYGWHVITTPRGTTDIYHGGGDYPRGVTAEFHRYVEEGITTIAICNSMMDDAGLVSIPRETFRAILFGGDHSPAPPDAHISFEPSKYTGTYRFQDGSLLRIVFQRGQLVAKVEGQNAIGLLIGYKPEINTELEKLNQRLLAVLQKAEKNQFSEEWTSDQAKVASDGFGTLQRFEVLGTVPITPDDLSTTYARLHFTGGTEVYRWNWRKERFVQILSGTPYPVIAPMVIRQPDHFVTHHLLMKTTAYIEFQKGAVKLHSQFGAAVAKKVNDLSQINTDEH